MASSFKEKHAIQLKLLDEKEYLARLAARHQFIDAWRRMVGWEGDPPYEPKILRQGYCPFLEVGTVVQLIDVFDPRAVVNNNHVMHKAHLVKLNAGRRQLNNRHKILDSLANPYWLQWAIIRPPIGIVCPDGYVWQVDAWQVKRRGDKTSVDNATCWMVTGSPDDDNLTVEGHYRTANHIIRVEDGVLYYKDRNE